MRAGQQAPVKSQSPLQWTSLCSWAFPEGGELQLIHEDRKITQPSLFSRPVTPKSPFQTEGDNIIIHGSEPASSRLKAFVGEKPKPIMRAHVRITLATSAAPPLNYVSLFFFKYPKENELIERYFPAKKINSQEVLPSCSSSPSVSNKSVNKTDETYSTQVHV
jgi:hypothetical protein